MDIPIAPGGVIDGLVMRALDATGVAGVTMLLRHVATGDERAFTSFSDGEFYLMGIRPGDYELTVSDETAARLGLSASVVRFRMEASAEGAAVSGLRVILR